MRAWWLILLWVGLGGCGGAGAGVPATLAEADTEVPVASTTNGDSDDPALGDTQDSDPRVFDTDPSVEPVEAPSGYAAFCERYLVCGGVFYDTAEACVEATLDYYGDCPEVRASLDAYGTCMLDVPCNTYDPDAYDPLDTPCAGAWRRVLADAC